jgi:hypothetical protein
MTSKNKENQNYSSTIKPNVFLKSPQSLSSKNPTKSSIKNHSVSPSRKNKENSPPITQFSKSLRTKFNELYNQSSKQSYSYVLISKSRLDSSKDGKVKTSLQIKKPPRSPLKKSNSSSPPKKNTNESVKNYFKHKLLDGFPSYYRNIMFKPTQISSSSITTPHSSSSAINTPSSKLLSHSSSSSSYLYPSHPSHPSPFSSPFSSCSSSSPSCSSPSSSSPSCSSPSSSTPSST